MTLDELTKHLRKIVNDAEPLAKEHAAKVEEMLRILVSMNRLAPVSAPLATRKKAEELLAEGYDLPRWKREARDKVFALVRDWLEGTPMGRTGSDEG